MLTYCSCLFCLKKCDEIVFYKWSKEGTFFTNVNGAIQKIFDNIIPWNCLSVSHERLGTDSGCVVEVWPQRGCREAGKNNLRGCRIARTKEQSRSQREVCRGCCVLIFWINKFTISTCQRIIPHVSTPPPPHLSLLCEGRTKTNESGIKRTGSKRDIKLSIFVHSFLLVLNV